MPVAIAAGTAEACREAVLDRFVSDQKHDRDRRGGRLRRQRETSCGVRMTEAGWRTISAANGRSRS